MVLLLLLLLHVPASVLIPALRANGGSKGRRGK